MNRHTSNPFLSDWDDEPEATINAHPRFDPNAPPTTGDDNERSSTQTRRSSSSQAEFGSNRARLLRRNMSSFEAASLQLEQQQQQMQENGAIASTQKDLIAQMTADFQSAIQTNDKQYESIDGFNPFDPFETIVDDDVSLPSPALSNQPEKTSSGQKVTRDDDDDDDNKNDTKNGNEPGDWRGEENHKQAHDSIDDDDDELVSTPVRNIKAHPGAPADHATSMATAVDRSEENSTAEPAREDASDSMAKASMLSSLLASAEASGQQGVEELSAPSPNDPEDGNYDRNTNESPTNPTHVIRGSPKSAGEANPERPVSFFDPFETVIDKDALTSLMNETQQQTNQTATRNEEGNAAGQEGHAEDSDALGGGVRVGESISVETLVEKEKVEAENPKESSSDAVADKQQRPELDEDKNDPNQRQKQTQESSKSSRLAQYDSSMAMGRPSGRSLVSGAPAPPPVTPMKRAQAKHKQPKVSTHSNKNEDDSSDSSSDDDRIQIVIKTRDASKPEANSQPAIVPLLPPPPSKSAIKQSRERGQVEDMPSPILGYKSKHERKDSSSDSDDDQVAASGTKKDDEQTAASSADLKASDKQESQDDEDGQHSNEGQFVIPMKHSDDEEGDNYGKPDTPLYDDDTSYELEEFPPKYEGPGWEMMLRYPPKKKLTSNRFWKKIFVKLAKVPPVADNNNSKSKKEESEPQICMVMQIFDKPEDKKPLQEIPIQATYTVSEISSQLFDQFGKIFTIKLQYIFYKERVGVRQGQLARFIHAGHIGSSTTSGGHGVDPISIGAIKRMGAPIEHSPQISQIIKLGCTSYEDIKMFKECLEDCLFRIPIHRDRALSTYKTEEVQMAVRDETYIEVNQVGTITRQMARVRLFFLSFLNGMPTVEVGVNDAHRQGREIVGRMDILPVVTEEWIRLEAWELHSTVAVKEFEDPNLRIVKLSPPDATFFEVMRFRVRPPRNRELPLQISANMSVTRTKVSINCEVMVPGCISRKHGQIPCENVAIRFRIPECWIYFFREEKHFRMGSKKSVNRRPGKVKGIERFLGGGGLQDFKDDSSLIEVTSGQAKYEHHHNAIVWRAARWPKESQSAYVQNTMKIRLPLTAYDKMPENFYEYVHVEYTMPATTVSHTTLRSISVSPCEDEPPEKYVKYSAKYEYKVKMRLSVNLGTRPGAGAAAEPEASPIIIMKQPDLHGDLQREEDSDDDDDDQSDVHEESN